MLSHLSEIRPGIGVRCTAGFMLPYYEPGMLGSLRDGSESESRRFVNCVSSLKGNKKCVRSSESSVHYVQCPKPFH